MDTQDEIQEDTTSMEEKLEALSDHDCKLSEDDGCDHPVHKYK